MLLNERELKKEMLQIKRKLLIGDKTISEIAKLFKIKIDVTREQDYKIVSLNPSELTIEIIDTKTNITYKSEFIGHCEPLSFHGPTQFINVTTEYENAKRNTYYYIGTDIIPIDNLEIYKDDNILYFGKEMPNRISFSNDRDIFRIKLLKNVVVGDKKYIDTIYKRSLSQKYICDESREIMEQVGVGEFTNHVHKNELIDKYSYVNNDNLIYGVSDNNIGDTQSLAGICLEQNIKNKQVLDKYLPIHLIYTNMMEFLKENVLSLIFFSGRCIKNHSDKISILKTDEEFKITLDIKIYTANPFGNDITKKIEKSIPILNSGVINSNEVEYLIIKLQELFKGVLFIELICQELNEFNTKLKIKNKIQQDTIDDLNPRLFANLPFSKVVSELVNNSDYYVDTALKQKDNLLGKKTDAVEKVLK